MERTSITATIGELVDFTWCTDMEPAYCWERLNGEYLGKCLTQEMETTWSGGRNYYIIFEHKKMQYSPDSREQEKVKRVECREVQQSNSSFLPSLPSFITNPMYGSRAEEAAVPESVPNVQTGANMARIQELETDLRNANATIARLRRRIEEMEGSQPTQPVRRTGTEVTQGGKKRKTKKKVHKK